MKEALSKISIKLKDTAWGYIIVYTLLFGLTALICYRYFILYGKTTIIVGDGISQNYNTLLYYCKLLRGVISGLKAGQGLKFPMWDFSAGLGEDILGVMHYYGVGEPVMLLAALVPPSRTDYLYCFIYLLRLYLGGLGFSWFSLWHGNRKFPTLIGAMLYVFSGYSLTLAIKHLMFGVPIVFFPFILLGADKVIRDKKPLLFIVSTALGAMSNIYFFYAMMFFAVIYCIFRLIRARRDFDLKRYLTTAGIFLLGGINAFLLSAIVLLPVLSLMLSESRIGRGYPYTLTYGLKYYFEYIAGFTDLQQAEGVMTTGYSVIALIALIILFTVKKRNFWLKLGAAAFLGFSFIPYFAYMMNGFSYVTNRWVWAHAMLLAYVAVKIYPEIFTLGDSEKRRVIYISLALAAVSLIIPSLRNMHTFASIIMLFIALILLNGSKTVPGDDIRARLAVTAVFLAGLYLLTYRLWSVDFEESGKYNISKFNDFNTADDILENRNSDATMEKVGDDGYYRTGEIGVTSSGGNSSLLRNVTLCRRYYSMMLPNVSEFIRELGFNTQMDFKLEGTDRRSIMDALLAVRYYNVKEGQEEKLPFDHDVKVAETDTYDGHSAAWKNEHYLPLGYTFDTAVPEKDFYALDLAGRQETMLYGAVLSDEAIEKTGIKTAQSILKRRSVLKGISRVSGGESVITDHGIDLKGRDAVFKLELNGTGNSETYVVLNDADFEGRRQRTAYTDSEWGALSRYDKARILTQDMFFRPDDEAVMYFGITPDDFTNRIEYFTPMHDCYTGHDSFITNLGYHKESLDAIYLKLSKPGFYSFSGLDVVDQSVEGITERLDELRADSLEDINIDCNTISGSIKTDRDKLLVMSIPYSTGWSAFVDGNKVDTYCANVMFLSLPVTAGDHGIRLQYETPYLRIGAVLTCVGIVMLLFITIGGICVKNRVR